MNQYIIDNIATAGEVELLKNRKINYKSFYSILTDDDFVKINELKYQKQLKAVTNYRNKPESKIHAKEYWKNWINKTPENYDKYLTWTRTSMAKLYARRKAECA